MIFPLELYNYVSIFLNIINKQKMKYINKSIYNYIKISKNEIDQIIINRINILTNSKIGIELLYLIKKYNNMFLGENIINQCLTNNFNDNSYIDLYIYYNKNELKNGNINHRYIGYYNLLYLLFNSIEFIKNVLDLMNYTNLDINYYLKIYGPKKLCYGNGHYIDYYTDNKLKLKIILIPNNEFINYFDFNKNYYDGINIYSYNKWNILNDIF